VERLTSIQSLRALQAELESQRDPGTPTIVIPAGTCGRASGADEVVAAARTILAGKATGPRLRVTGCHGFCQMEPSVLVEPSRTFYRRVKVKDMPRIIDAATNGKPVEDLLCSDPETRVPIPRQDDLPFYRKQVRTILSRNERVDPTSIQSYLEAGGYCAIASVLERAEPKWVVEQVKASGLRGRGGAGFPTGVKWELLANQTKSPTKFLVCNADEGDPGAYMDRSLLEGNPHAIIEGMLIGAFGTGAREGFVYVRNEYPLAIEHLSLALRQAYELGLLGSKVLGTDFAFDLSLVRGAGAFVCGEETALIRSIEGRTGEPRQRPPFPVQRGIEGKPTAINNVETWANVVLVMERGAEAFAKIGTRRNSGTKIFSLVGKVKNTGLVEIPMGMTLAEITQSIGGGPSGKAPIKAVQTGGPSGGCIPRDRFDLPVDYDSLTEAGSIMGSGGMIVMDEQTCMVDVAKYFMRFLKEESCGKCLTCRKGTQRMHEILDDICTGQASVQDLTLLRELAHVVKDTTQCALGQTAANPVLSTLRYFSAEYLAHIEHGRCPAGVCKALITFAINENCLGCDACAKACAQGAITGERKQRHRIDPEKCNKCGSCRSVCKTDAVYVT
jgi:NADH-quinone oxidoreductase subunit F